MISFTLSALTGALLLQGALARPSNAARSTTCSATMPPEGARCGSEGSVANQGTIIDNGSPALGLGGCIDNCASTHGCTSFLWGGDQTCLLYSGDVSALGFTEGSTDAFLFQMECFECVGDEHGSEGGSGGENLSSSEDENRDDKLETLFSVNFEDGSYDNWGINDDIGAAYDIRKMNTPNGETNVFVILEPPVSGFTSIDNSQVFQLPSSERGTVFYKLGFTAKCSFVPQFGHTDWSPIRIVLWNNGGQVLSQQPTEGTALGSGWVRFEEEFALEGVSGDATLSILVETKGWAVDWFFDDIWVAEEI